MDSFRDVIGLWPSRAAFAEDVGMSPGTARMLHLRDALPSEYWVAAIAGADRRGLTGVTLELLARLAARGRPAAPPAVPSAETANA